MATPEQSKQRLLALATTAPLSRAAWVGLLLNDRVAAEVSLAARLRLDAAGPLSGPELAASAAWFPRWRAAVAARPGAGIDAAVVADLARRQRAAWVTLVAAATTPDTLSVALTVYGGCGITTLDEAKAAMADHPGAYYDLLMSAPGRPETTPLLTFLPFNDAAATLPAADLEAIRRALTPKPTELPWSQPFRLVVADPSWYRWPGRPFQPHTTFRLRPVVKTNDVPPVTGGGGTGVVNNGNGVVNNGNTGVSGGGTSGTGDGGGRHHVTGPGFGSKQ